MCLFSTDYPHVEGGRNPLKRFAERLNGLPPTALDGFYAENFIDLFWEVGWRRISVDPSKRERETVMNASPEL